jgi:glycosyltransferase involved in cell wall biosynthesis
MTGQTVLPAEFVLVRDHEVSAEIANVINERAGGSPVKYVDAYDLFGHGLGALRARGVENCSFELIACMDSDDISFLDRCEKQLAVFNDNPDIAVVGGIIAEFSTTPQEIVSYRKVPENYEDIVKFSKLRCPFNNPSVMFRKDVVLAVGNYKPIKGCEDYDLWFRILKDGYKGYNLPCLVLYYRTGDQFLKRRRNKIHYQSYINLKKEMRKEKYIGWKDFQISVNVQRLFYYSPAFIQKYIYRLLRKDFVL